MKNRFSHNHLKRMYSPYNYTQQEININLIQKMNEVIEYCNRVFEAGGYETPDISISFNGNTYTPDSNGLISLPNCTTSGGSNTGLSPTQEQQITTAYNHSRSKHAPIDAEQNVQSNWNETDTSSDAYIKNKPTLSTVATSGSYNDLNNKPTLSNVATSGSYNDLSNKPTIPSVPSNLVTGASNSYIIWTGTQSQYDSITSKDNNTLYFIKE